MKKLIKKYLDNSASKKEQKILSGFLDSFQKKKCLQEYNLNEYIIYDKDQFYKLKKKCVEADRSKKNYSLAQVVKYAAILIVLFGVSTFLYFISYENNKIFSNYLNEITITDTNGEIKVIEEHIVFDLQKNDSIIDNISNEIEYISINVPKGKTFNMVLVDGTKVFLNASSSIQIPTDFKYTQERKVVLKGEAYFDVTKNKEKPFIVESWALKTTVLGTKFNVSAYPEDPKSSITLIEGKVGVQQQNSKSKNEMQIMHPNQKAVYQKNNNEIKLTSVKAINSIAWIEGYLYFKNENFTQVVRRIERNYNIKIINKYPDLNNESFTGKFDSKKGIEHLLNVFSQNIPFNYKVNKSEIIITSKTNKPMK
ncbi:FecR family protein [Aquimarina sediminis]|uniref:FecR family protein n=1 Tax=Aquimarina sediminis TaxID=2070536 RepID=UPI000CA06530|nr:FecR family protein [Aquimarina sediminis]